MPYQTLLSGLYPPSPKLGLIEGFFGKGWSWEARARYAQWLPRHGYGFYLYAPKEDGLRACRNSSSQSRAASATPV